MAATNGHRHGLPARCGLLLLNLGTPQAPTPPALRRYLGEFLADPRVVEAYRRTVPVPSVAEAALLAAAEADPRAFAWHFSSSEAVRNLVQLAPAARWRASIAFATHPRIAEAARAAGFTDVRTLAPGTQALAHAWSMVGAGEVGEASEGAGSTEAGEGPPLQSRPL